MASGGTAVAARRSKLKLAAIVLVTNLVSVYLFSGATLSIRWPEPAPGVQQWTSEALHLNLNATRAALAAATEELLDVRRKCSASSALLETLLAELGRVHGDRAASESFNGWPDEPAGELKLAVGPHKLPFGFTRNLGTDELYPALGFGCRNFMDDVTKYMSYNVSGECPQDEAFAQQLLLKGCEPLPRRRCKPRSPRNYAAPLPLPESLWTIPPDNTVLWDEYSCKNYSCLVKRGKTKGTFDCKDCFNLAGRERTRWLTDNGGLDFGIDNVLAARPPGTVRVGLDIGGGTGTFAARMRERNVTVVTTTMNLDGPFNQFVAARGLVPLQISVVHRLPFADGTLDIVHSMHVLSNWMPDAVLELALFDIYRVLRPAGIFWLDHFFCLGSQLNGTYLPMLERVGFGRLRWFAGRKLDRGVGRDEWYVSALLERPAS